MQLIWILQDTAWYAILPQKYYTRFNVHHEKAYDTIFVGIKFLDANLLTPLKFDFV